MNDWLANVDDHVAVREKKRKRMHPSQQTTSPLSLTSDSAVVQVAPILSTTSETETHLTHFLNI